VTDFERQRSNDFLGARVNWWITVLGVVLVNVLTWAFPNIVTPICKWSQETVMAISIGAFNVASAIKMWLDRRAVKAAKTALPLLLALLSGCAGLPQKLDPSLQYRNDMPFCVEGYGCFEGATVLPRLPSYKFELAPKGDARVDFFVVTTCNRNKTFEPGDAGFTWDVLGLFGKKKSGLRYIYVPLPDREDDGDCPLIFHTYEKERGRHAWAYIQFENPKYELPATLYCDGDKVNFKGVGVCQAKAGLRQWFEFPEPVMIQPGRPEKGGECAVPAKDATGTYQLTVTKEECRYGIHGQSGRRHLLTTIGYSGELIRETK
jgi:hypothetical protein